jgi:hypothetical protein
MMKLSTPALSVASLLAVAALSACGSVTTKTVTEQAATPASDASDTSPTETTAAAKPEPKPVEVQVEGPTVSTRDQVKLHGTVSPYGAKVKVDGQRAAVDGRSWSKLVTLKNKGQNYFNVTATLKGHESAHDSASVRRKLSEAEKAAAQAAKKQNFMASAGTFPYNQLLAHPSRFEGKRAKFYGEIFQVEEDGDSTVILLSVTDQGYGFWDDHVWITYDGQINGAEGDKLTAWGTLTGTESYDTQAGGNTTVPRMHAKYIAE